MRSVETPRVAKTTGKERKTCIGQFKQKCLRGHSRVNNVDDGGHCLTCLTLRKKGPLEVVSAVKETCVYGHSKINNTSKNGHCLSCRRKEVSPEYSREAGWRTYGIVNEDGTQFTFKEYNRAFQIQGGRCKGCARHQTAFKKALCADHDRKTGLFRGLLCFHCNFILGLAKDDIKILETLTTYLRGSL